MSVFNKKFTITDIKSNNPQPGSSYKVIENKISSEDINNEIKLFFPKRDSTKKRLSLMGDNSNSDILTRTSTNTKIKKTVTFKLDVDVKPIKTNKDKVNCKCIIF